MNRWLRNIIIMMSVIVVSIGANAIVRQIDKSTVKTPAETSDTIYISNYSVGSAEKIVIENQYGTLTLIADGENWYAKGYEDVELDQGVVYELAYMLTHIVAQREVSDSIDTTDTYGMLNPNSVITTYHTGVVEQKFTIGDLSPIENEYYLQSSIYKKVYTIDGAYYIYSQVKLEDLMELKGVEIPHENMVKIMIEDAYGQEYTIERTADDNDVSLCYWEFTKDFNHDIDTGVMYGTSEYSGMITAITQLKGQRVVGHVDRNEKEYGLDEPIYTATIFGNNNMAQRFMIGDYGDEENYSLAFNDDSSIYTVSKDAVKFVDYSAYVIADANLALISITPVDKVSIDLPQIKTNLDISLIPRKNADGSGMLDANNNPVYDANIEMSELNQGELDGVNIDEQKLWFYQDIVTIKIDDLILEEVYYKDKIGSIVFDLQSHIRENYVLEFYEYNASHYLVKKNNDSASFLVSKTQIDNLANRYELLLKGQLTRDY